MGGRALDSFLPETKRQRQKLSKSLHTLTSNLASSFLFLSSKASIVAQLVKNLPAMRETWVQSLDWEDPLEKGKAAHSGILA